MVASRNVAPKCTHPPGIFLLLHSLLPHSDHFTIYLPIAEFLRGAAAANGGSSPTSPSGTPGWQVRKPSCLYPPNAKADHPFPAQAGTRRPTHRIAAGHRTSPRPRHGPEASRAWRLLGAESSSPPHARSSVAVQGGRLGFGQPARSRPSLLGLRFRPARVTPQRARRVSAVSSGGGSISRHRPHARTDFFEGGCRKRFPFPHLWLDRGQAWQHRQPAAHQSRRRSHGRRGTGGRRGASPHPLGESLPLPAARGSAQGCTAACAGMHAYVAVCTETHACTGMHTYTEACAGTHACTGV